jgi:hypothetical protein
MVKRDSFEPNLSDAVRLGSGLIGIPELSGTRLDLSPA